MTFTEFLCLSISKKSILTTHRQGNFVLQMDKNIIGTKEAYAGDKVIKPEVPESLPLVQITSKTDINQSATVATVIRKAQKTRIK